MNSQKQALKSSGIVGGAKVGEQALRFLQFKLIAIFLGPAGIGLFGLYQGALQLVDSLTGFGFGPSAVRSLAEASGTGDESKISRTVIVLRRCVWLTGLFGTLVTGIFSRQLSLATFGSTDYSTAFVALSVTLLMLSLSRGQLAVLQGLRQIEWMARATLIGTVFGVAVSLPVIYWLRESGIVPAIVILAAAQLAASWWFAGRIQITNEKLGFVRTAIEAWPMAKLGVCMVSATIFSLVTMYGMRAWIMRRLDLDAVGQFQAAWSVSNQYIGLVLVAMGADFYPRLTACNSNHRKMARLVDEQAEVSLLLGGPIVIAVIAAMPMIVWALYSNAFEGTILILRWQLAGTFLRLLMWPTGFVQLAMGAGGLLIATEFLWHLTYVVMVVALWPAWGLESVGIAFLGACVFLFVWNYFWAWKLVGFRWSRKTLRLASRISIAVAIVSISGLTLPDFWTYVLGGLLAGVSAYCSMRKVFRYAGGYKNARSWALKQIPFAKSRQ